MSTDRLLKVGVRSARSGTAQATWGQQAIWDVVQGLGADAPRYNLALSVPIEPGRPVPLLLEDLTALLHLHDSLRTRLRPDESGVLRQVLDGGGELPVVLWQCAVEEVAERSGRLLADLLGRPFETAGQWPVRTGLVEADGAVRHLVLVLSHTASDGWGIRRLHQDLLDLWRGIGVAPIRLARPSLQPLDEAAQQASERDAAARRHWCERLAAGPERLFPLGGRAGDAAAGRAGGAAGGWNGGRAGGAAGAEPDPARLLPNARLYSPALARAVGQVAAGRGVSGSSVLLAAAAVQQSRLSGADGALLQVVVNNRFLPAATQAVSTMAQEGLFHLPSTRGDFAEVLGRAHLAALGSYRHAGYDKRLLDRDIAELRSGAGVVADRSCTFNDARIIRADAADRPDDVALEAEAARTPLSRLRARSTLSWPVEFPSRGDFSFAMDALYIPGALELAMTADAERVSRAGMEQFLCGIEDLVVAEATALGCG
jgi:hypothetical protein